MIDSLLGYLTTTAMPLVFAGGGTLLGLGLLALPVSWKIKGPLVVAVALWGASGYLATKRCNAAWVALLEADKAELQTRLDGVTAKVIMRDRDLKQSKAEISELTRRLENATSGDVCRATPGELRSLTEDWRR